MKITETYKNNFWKKVDKSGGESACWNWTASKNRQGYGAFGRQEERRAHRVSWILKHGEIPSGMFVCHHCDNPSCVNPSHLFVGDASANMRDRNAKGRHNLPRGKNHFFVIHPELRPRGESHKGSRLKGCEVLKIRELHAAGRSQMSLAREFKVRQGNIFSIIKRLTWNHI